MKQYIESNIDLIVIDGQYEEAYKKALYMAQKSKEYQELMDVFGKCQLLLNDKLESYSSLIEQVKQEP